VKKRLFIYSLVLLSAFTEAQDISCRFNRLSSIDGIPQNSIISIYKDSKGFMWFGTFSGVFRYDGNTVKVFLPEDKNTINANVIYSIGEDYKGNIYFATRSGGVNVYSYNTETFSYYKEDSTEKSIVSNVVYSIKQTSDSNMWLAAYSGVGIIDVKNNKIKSYRISDGKFSPFSSLSICETTDKTILIGTYAGGICKYDTKRDTFLRYENNLSYNDNYNSNIINKIEQVSDSTVLINTNDGFFIFNFISNKYNYSKLNVEALDFAIDKEKNIWLTTNDSGLYKVDSLYKIIKIQTNPNVKYTLPSNNLRTIYLDNNGILWVGIDEDGVAFFNTKQPEFYHLYKKSNDNSLIDNSVFGFTEDDDNNIWIATMGGVSIYNPKKNTYKNIKSNGTNSTIYNNRVWDIFYDNSGYIWMASNGIDKYDIKTKTFKHYSHKKNDTTSLPANEVFCFEKDKLGRIWVGTYMGIAIYSEKDDKWIPFKNNDKISYKEVLYMLSDTDGIMWIGTSEKLYRYNIETDSIGEFKIPYLKNLNLQILSIFQDSDGVLWFGSQKGLLRYSLKQDTVVRFGIEHGLPNEFIYKVLESGDYIWFSSNKGLIKMNKYTFEITNFDVFDGLQDNEFNSAALKYSDGMFYFGGINGITAFYPDSIRQTSEYNKLKFTKLSINGKQVYPKKKYSNQIVIKESITTAKKITLSYKQKLFAIEFSALEYLQPKKIKYRYKLLPASEDWIELNNKNSITFTDLPPGKYILEIQSSNPKQKWLDNAIMVNIHIIPPFYKRIWFYIFIAVIFSFLIVLYIKIRINRIRKVKEKLEQIVSERTEEIKSQKEELEVQRDRISEQKATLEKFTENLEKQVKERTEELLVAKEKAEESDKLKSAFLSNMSHEIRTPMNAIIGFSDLLTNIELTEEEKNEYVKIIHQNSETLLNLLNDILDISIIESGKIKVNIKEININNIIKEVFCSFSHSFLLNDKPNLKLKIKLCKNNNLFLKADDLRLKQILNNLIGNAIKYTNKGEVIISVERDINNIIFKIKDTGIGIKQTNIDKIFDRFRKIDDNDTNPYRGGGLGLAISKNLTELMGGKIWAESQIGKGSVFFVSFPNVYEK
jgi:signal transduction histidine kinase/ligand-binding sensor domain-containing protein